MDSTQWIMALTVHLNASVIRHVFLWTWPPLEEWTESFGASCSLLTNTETPLNSLETRAPIISSLRLQIFFRDCKCVLLSTKEAQNFAVRPEPTRKGGGGGGGLSLLNRMTGLYILCLEVGSIMSEILFQTDPYVMIAQLLNGSSSPQSPFLYFLFPLKVKKRGGLNGKFCQARCFDRFWITIHNVLAYYFWCLSLYGIDYLLLYHYFAEHFSVQFGILDWQKRIQPVWCNDWLRFTRDQITDVLEHTLFQGLSRYEG